MIEVPFFKNEGHRCAETVIRTVLKYYFPESEYSLREISQLAKKRRGKFLYMVQVANVFLNFGIKIDYYSSYGLERYLSENPIETFKKVYGHHAEKIIKHTDFSALEECIKNIIKSGNYKKMPLTFNDVEKSFYENNLIVCLLNHDILVGRDNNTNGHYVIITGINTNNVWYHKSGPVSPKPNVKIKKERFIQAWNKMCYFDEDTLIIKGVI